MLKVHRYESQYDFWSILGLHEEQYSFYHSSFEIYQPLYDWGPDLTNVNQCVSPHTQLASCPALDGHRKGASGVPFDNYLGPNRLVQMSIALGISGFAFHNAAETERLTKPDCSKFHTMELHFPSLNHQHCHSDRPGHCWGVKGIKATAAMISHRLAVNC